MAKLPFDRTWYVAQTLISFGDGINRNRRSIGRGNDNVATFNYRMDEWHEDDDRALQELVTYLNRLERECMTQQENTEDASTTGVG